LKEKSAAQGDVGSGSEAKAFERMVEGWRAANAHNGA
jgi:hypothetical protein